MPGYDTPQIAESMPAREDEPRECDLWAFVTLSYQCEREYWAVGRSCILRPLRAITLNFHTIGICALLLVALGGYIWWKLRKRRQNRLLAEKIERERKERMAKVADHQKRLREAQDEVARIREEGRALAV